MARDEHGRTEPALDGDEATTLLGFLELQRGTFAWKTGGLDAAALRVTLGPSSLTLGGLLKHLAVVEDIWITQRFRGAPMPSPWNAVDWSQDPDWEWTSAATDTPDDLRRLWQAAVGRSRVAVDEALASGGGLGQLVRLPRPDGSSPSLRWILCHLIEEYARHNGHADLIRESIDGVVGE